MALGEVEWIPHCLIDILKINLEIQTILYGH